MTGAAIELKTGIELAGMSDWTFNEYLDKLEAAREATDYRAMRLEDHMEWVVSPEVRRRDW